MSDRLAAERACKDANPIIDGRKANVNLAYLGAKPRGNLQSGIIWYLHLQSIYWFDLFLPLFLGGRFSCCCCCFLFFFLTFFGVWNFFFLFFFSFLSWWNKHWKKSFWWRPFSILLLDCLSGYLYDHVQIDRTRHAPPPVHYPNNTILPLHFRPVLPFWIYKRERGRKRCVT